MGRWTRVVEQASALFTPPSDASTSGVRAAGAKGVGAGLLLCVAAIVLMAVTPPSWRQTMARISAAPLIPAIILITLGSFRLVVGSDAAGSKRWLRLTIALAFGTTTIALMAAGAIAVARWFGL